MLDRHDSGNLPPLSALSWSQQWQRHGDSGQPRLR